MQNFVRRGFGWLRVTIKEKIMKMRKIIREKLKALKAIFILAN
jgi:hypothetical protein